jgi:hypothetical protein
VNFTILGFPAVVLILLTASTLLVSRKWRLSILALCVQYVGVFALVAMQGHLQVALAKLVAGWIAGAVLGLAMAGSKEPSNVLTVKSEGESGTAPTAIPSGWLFRLLAVGIVGLAVSSIVTPLVGWAPGLQFEQAWGALLLIGLGFLHLGLTTQPLNVGLGLLTVLSGFEILYSAVEISVLVTGLLASVNLGLALVGAYLLLAPSLEEEEA